jgi:eukaryotic-like serine/threonine-protein kinase
LASTEFARTLTSVFKPSSTQPVGDATIAGTRIGRYKTVSRIGDGAMGAVYAAYDPVLSRTIALKTLNLNLPPEERTRFEASFLDEARAVAKLNHPNIVTVYDAGKSPQGPYIAMELLEGEELRTMLARGERLSPSKAAELVSRVADALAYAHASGIVHRDIKPGNIFMAGGGGKTQPKVLDFGIAQVARKPVTAASADTVLGSPAYMAPECVRGESVDGRSDIWSAGVVLYELLTGRTPFAGESLQHLLQAILNDAPQPPHALNASVPLELSRITARALAKRPEDRYQAAKELADDLKRWIAASRVKKLIEAGSTTSPTQAVRVAKAGNKRLMFLGALALAAVAVLLVVTFSPALREPGAPAPTASAPAKPAAPIAAAAPVAVPTVAVAALPTALPAAIEPAVAALPTALPAAIEPAAVAQPSPASTIAAAPEPATAATAAPATPTRAQREARDRQLAAERAAALRAQRAAQAAPAATGQVALAISPWGEVFVDGASKGTSPPLTSLNLPVGKHTIEVRNGDAPPHVVSVQVEADAPVRVRHKFGG